MMITTPEIDEQQRIIDHFNYKRNFTLDEHLILQEALKNREMLIDRLASQQLVDRRAIVRARLGIK